jgi:hypothetical protein
MFSQNCGGILDSTQKYFEQKLAIEVQLLSLDPEKETPHLL